MAEKTYIHDNYYFKVNRGIKKLGTEICNEKGPLNYALYNLSHEGYNDLYLNYKDENQFFDNYDSDENFKNILILARKYATENHLNLFINPTIQKYHDAQNFIMYENDLFVPMSNEEIVKLNEHGIQAHVKIPDRTTKNNYNYAFTMPYITSSGHITLDVHSSPEKFRTVFIKNDNDYSNIIKVQDTGINPISTRIGFYDNKDLKQIQKLPKVIEEKINLSIACQEMLSYEIEAKYLTLPENLDIERKNTDIEMKYNVVERLGKTIDSLSQKYDNQIPSTSKELKEADRLIKFIDAHKDDFDYSFDKKLEHIKAIRECFKIVKKVALEM